MELDPDDALAYGRENGNATPARQAVGTAGVVRTAGTPLERLLAKGNANHRYMDRRAVLSLSPSERAGVLQEIGDAKQNNHMFSNIREGMKQFFPADYAGWLASRPEQASETQKFAPQWAGEEPQAAAAWVLKLPGGETKTTAAGSIAAQWAALDPRSGRRMGAVAPAGPERESAMQALQAPDAPQ